MPQRKVKTIASRRYVVRPDMPPRTSLREGDLNRKRIELEKAIRLLARVEGERFTITYMEGIVEGLIGHREIQTLDEGNDVLQVVKRWTNSEKKIKGDS